MSTSTRMVYINGDFVPETEASISVFDRGFLFADAVYEVSAVLSGKLLDNEAHLQRLQRSLSELHIAMPLSIDELVAAQEKTVRQNLLLEGLLYLQVTRGVADRDFAFPQRIRPTVVMFTQEKNLLSNPLADCGLRVISVEDIRWQRCDIKTVGLLAASMAKQQALEAGADDAWLVTDGMVKEGTSNNAYIVTQDGTIVTRQLDNGILHGITRRSLLALAKEQGLRIEERPFSLEEAYAASEAFISSAATFALPVVGIDKHPVGDGKPGPIARRLRELYIKTALRH